jgi:hypothetical protein
MAVSRALRRLLRIRDLEEEQSRLALESTLGDLNRLKHAQAAAIARDRRGRLLVGASIHSGEVPDRLAGLEESRAANRSARTLAPMIEEAELEVVTMREQYLASRVERRQAETLIKEAEVRDALDADRKSQQGLDDWFRNRMHRDALKEKRREPAGSAIASSTNRE